MKVTHKPGEDFSVILLDRGILEDHLPNNVLSAMKRCQAQLITPHYTSEEIQRRRKEIQEQFSPPERNFNLPISAHNGNNFAAVTEEPRPAMAEGARSTVAETSFVTDIRSDAQEGFSPASLSSPMSFNGHTVSVEVQIEPRE